MSPGAHILGLFLAPDDVGVFEALQFLGVFVGSSREEYNPMDPLGLGE